jgi:hypothetical protein
MMSPVVDQQKKESLFFSTVLASVGYGGVGLAGKGGIVLQFPVQLVFISLRLKYPAARGISLRLKGNIAIFPVELFLP